MATLYRIALVLVIVGAINWGLIGFFRFDLVAFIFGGQSAIVSRWVYALVGISGLISIPIISKPLVEGEVRRETRYRDGVASYGMESSDELGYDSEQELYQNDNNRNK